VRAITFSEKAVSSSGHLVGVLLYGSVSIFQKLNQTRPNLLVFCSYYIYLYLYI